MRFLNINDNHYLLLVVPYINYSCTVFLSFCSNCCNLSAVLSSLASLRHFISVIQVIGVRRSCSPFNHLTKISKQACSTLQKESSSILSILGAPKPRAVATNFHLAATSSMILILFPSSLSKSCSS